jgi:hypothetical protein
MVSYLNENISFSNTYVTTQKIMKGKSTALEKGVPGHPLLGPPPTLGAQFSYFTLFDHNKLFD